MNITTVQEFKELIGKTIYAIPTGNNARGWKGEFVRFDVISAKRKYVVLAQHHKFGGLPFTSEYDPTYGCFKGAGSSSTGYKFFPTLESITEYQNRNELADKLSKKCDVYSNPFRKMSVADLEAVIAILDKYEDVK